MSIVTLPFVIKRPLLIYVFFILTQNLLAGTAYTGKSSEKEFFSQNTFTLTKRISFKCQACTLKEVLDGLANVSGAKFIYNANDIQDNVARPLEYKDIMLRQVLKEVLLPHNLTFKSMNERIVIKKLGKVPSGTIRGTIYDAENPSEILPGASVRIEGTDRGAAAGIDGDFEILNLPVGTYNLIISFIGYQTRKVENIQVIENNVTVIEVPMTSSAKTLGELIIKGDIPVQYAPIDLSTEVSLISSIKESDFIVTGISNEQIVRSQDWDASEVARRIPGVSMLNDFVLIRGMNPRYNLTMLNNMVTPSSEMDTRAFSFNLVPSQVIDRIVVHKSPAPELPGNFGGGVIKIHTKNTSTARRIQISLSGQYRTEGSHFTDLLSYEGSDKDWYGGGVDDRQLPGKLIEPGIEFQPLDGPNGLETEEVLRRLPPIRTPKDEYHDFDKQFNLNYYDSWKLGETLRLNNLTSVTYTRRRQFRKLERNLFAGQLGRNDPDNELIRTPGQLSTDSLYRDRVWMSGMQNLGLVINEDHRIDFTSFVNRNALDDLLVRESIQDDDVSKQRIYSFRYNKRDLLQAQISGNHTFGRQEITWSAGINRAYDDMPDLQRFIYTQNPDVHGDSLWVAPVTIGATFNTRMTFSTEEAAQIYQLNYQNDLSRELYVKAGLYLEQRNRDFESYRYRVVPFLRGGLGDVTAREPWVNVVDTLFNDHFFADQSGLNFQPFFGPGDYSFEDEVRAGYLGAGTRLLQDKLKVYGGVRYEWNERLLFDVLGNELDSVALFEPGEFGRVPNGVREFLLPSINISYDLSNKSLTRFAYGKTIDRPEFREQSTFGFFDFEAGETIRSNPLLKNAEIHNFDLRFEHYPSTSEFIAVGVFYKRLINAIERIDVTGPGFDFPVINFSNSDRATVYGLEAEVRKNLAFINNRLNNFSVIFNGAILESNVEYTPPVELAGQIDGDEELILERSLQGTSPYIVNAALYYDNEKTGTKASVLYNIAGSRMVAAPTVRLGGLYERERHMVDLSVTQQVLEWFSIKAGVQNLLNAPYRFFRDETLNNRYNPGDIRFLDEDNLQARTDFEEIRYTVGSYYSLALNFTF